MRERLNYLEYLIPAAREEHKETPGVEAGQTLEGVKALAETLMEIEVKYIVGADTYKRSQYRRTYRNGYRERVWCTYLGEVPLRIPKLRRGSYFPTFLEDEEQAEYEFINLVQNFYEWGVNPRKMEELIERLGVRKLSKKDVAQLCQVMTEEIERQRYGLVAVMRRKEKSISLT